MKNEEDGIKRVQGSLKKNAPLFLVLAVLAGVFIALQPEITLIALLILIFPIVYGMYLYNVNKRCSQIKSPKLRKKLLEEAERQSVRMFKLMLTTFFVGALIIACLFIFLK